MLWWLARSWLLLPIGLLLLLPIGLLGLLAIPCLLPMGLLGLLAISCLLPIGGLLPWLAKARLARLASLRAIRPLLTRWPPLLGLSPGLLASLGWLPIALRSSRWSAEEGGLPWLSNLRVACRRGWSCSVLLLATELLLGSGLSTKLPRLTSRLLLARRSTVLLLAGLTSHRLRRTSHRWSRSPGGLRCRYLQAAGQHL